MSEAALATAARLLEEHRRDHLTDGQWHDRCWFCLHRRVYGGDGVTLETLGFYGLSLQQAHS